MAGDNGDGNGNGNTARIVLGLLVTILVAFSGYAYYHSSETERIADARINQRLDIIETRQADVRERLRALEYRIDRHEQIDDQRFRDVRGSGGRGDR